MSRAIEVLTPLFDSSCIYERSGFIARILKLACLHQGAVIVRFGRIPVTKLQGRGCKIHEPTFYPNRAGYLPGDLQCLPVSGLRGGVISRLVGHVGGVTDPDLLVHLVPRLGEPRLSLLILKPSVIIVAQMEVAVPQVSTIPSDRIRGVDLRKNFYRSFEPRDSFIVARLRKQGVSD